MSFETVSKTPEVLEILGLWRAQDMKTAIHHNGLAGGAFAII